MVALPFALSVFVLKNVSKGGQMNDFYVYILKCNDNSYCVGHTDNIEERISEHMVNEYDCYTSSQLPVEIVFD